MSKTIFLTGGSSGIGQAISQKLTQADWRVIAPTHQELDLANLDNVTAFAASDHFPATDITALVYVGGIWHDKDTTLADKQFGNFTAEQIVQTMNVGLISLMLLTNQLIMRGKSTHIIGISGTFESGGKGWLPYYTSKRALEDFLLGLAQDNPKLTVYGISPADTATEAYKRFYPEYAKSAQEPGAIANAVMSLLHRDTSYPSGSIIVVRDGQQKLRFHA